MDHDDWLELCDPEESEIVTDFEVAARRLLYPNGDPLNNFQWEPTVD